MFGTGGRGLPGERVMTGLAEGGPGHRGLCWSSLTQPPAAFGCRCALGRTVPPAALHLAVLPRAQLYPGAAREPFTVAMGQVPSFSRSDSAGREEGCWGLQNELPLICAACTGPNVGGFWASRSCCHTGREGR